MQASSPHATNNPRRFDFTGVTYIADSHREFVINDHRLSFRKKITVSGPVLSLVTDGRFTVVVASTKEIAPPSFTVDPGIIEFGEERYTADSEGGFIIIGEILGAENKITVSGTMISPAKHGAFAIINFRNGAISSPSITDLPTLSFNGRRYTADSYDTFIINKHSPPGVSSQFRAQYSP